MSCVFRLVQLEIISNIYQSTLQILIIFIRLQSTFYIMSEKKRKILGNITDFFESNAAKKVQKKSEECKDEELKTEVATVSKIEEIMEVRRRRNELKKIKKVVSLIKKKHPKKANKFRFDLKNNVYYLKEYPENQKILTSLAADLIKNMMKWTSSFKSERLEFNYFEAAWKCGFCDKRTSKWRSLNSKPRDQINKHCGTANYAETHKGKDHRTLKKIAEIRVEEQKNAAGAWKNAQGKAVKKANSKAQKAAIAARICATIARNQISCVSFFEIRDCFAEIMESLDHDKEREMKDILAKVDEMRSTMGEMENELNKFKAPLTAKPLKELLEKLKKQLTDLKQIAEAKLNKLIVDSETVGKTPARGTNSACSARNIFIKLSEEIMKVNLRKIRAADFISIMIDESSDKSKKEQLLVYVKYFDVETMKVRVDMIAIMKLKGLDAKAISKALLEELRRFKIDIKKSLFAFGSDGASVMRGENGVGRMVETEVQHDLIILHCMCHVQALSAKEGVKSSILAQTVEELMRTIASDFSKSPKKCCRFEDIQEEWEQKILKMLKKHEVR